MCAIEEIFAFLNDWAPVETAEPWDNPGLLVRMGDVTEGVLCALDITPATVAEAAEKRCALIVSHHPVIFHPLKTLCAGDVPARLARAGISAICMHTNLDKGPGGVNDALAQRIGLRGAVPFAGGLGRVGDLDAAMEPDALAQTLRERLESPVRYAGAHRPLRRAAVVGGSGGDLVSAAAAAGADCLITGDAGHHDALDAAAVGVTLFAATHFSTERWIVPVLARRLSDAFGDLRVYQSEADAEPFAFRV